MLWVIIVAIDKAIKHRYEVYQNLMDIKKLNLFYRLNDIETKIYISVFSKIEEYKEIRPWANAVASVVSSIATGSAVRGALFYRNEGRYDEANVLFGATVLTFAAVAYFGYKAITGFKMQNKLETELLAERSDFLNLPDIRYHDLSKKLEPEPAEFFS